MRLIKSPDIYEDELLGYFSKTLLRRLKSLTLSCISKMKVFGFMHDLWLVGMSTYWEKTHYQSH